MRSCAVLRLQAAQILQGLLKKRPERAPNHILRLIELSGENLTRINGIAPVAHLDLAAFAEPFDGAIDISG